MRTGGRPVPTTTEVPASHFLRLAEAEATHFWSRSRLNWAEDFIRARFPDPTRLNVVDYGCGTGGFLHILRERLGFRSALGLDVSDDAIAHAHRLRGDYRVLTDGPPLPAETMLVTLMDVLEHVEDDSGVLARLLRDIAPGGAVLVSVPAHPALYSSWDRDLGHFRRYSKSKLVASVGRAGGRVERITHAFSYLWPAAWMRRFGRSHYQVECAFPRVPPLMNAALMGLNGIERGLSGAIPVPFGTSLFALVGRSE
jgi:2-polyprenyl-3-methyl-5-hydroxy-6-metoxy-1,4-benzoquinol methylase